MVDKKGKRAVVINNIKSGSIEQAIFILKSPVCETSKGVGRAIVDEAQEIINNYISMVERPMRRKNVSPARAILLAGAAIGFLAIAACILAFL